MFGVVEEQDRHHHLLAHDLTFHWYADVSLSCRRNRHPFGTFRHPDHHRKTFLSDDALFPRAVDSEDVYHWNDVNDVCGLCFVTRNLFDMFALLVEETLWENWGRILRRIW